MGQEENLKNFLIHMSKSVLERLYSVSQTIQQHLHCAHKQIVNGGLIRQRKGGVPMLKLIAVVISAIIITASVNVVTVENISQDSLGVEVACILDYDVAF